ncbi:glycosyltransferase family 4 protein [Thalassiella azotivora]
MRITYIHQHFRLPSEPGGTRSWEFARRLVADGHQVTVLAAGEQAEDRVVDGVRLLRLPVTYDNSMGFARRLLAFALFMVRATVAAVRLPADVVLASSTPLTVAVPGMVASVVRRARFVLEVRDLWPTVPVELGLLRNPVLKVVARWLELLAYRRARPVVALSPGMAEGVLDRHPGAEVVVVPNAADRELFGCDDARRAGLRRELGWSDDERVVVYAGSFGHIYGMEWVVRLAAALAGRGYRFVLIGSGATWEACRRLAVEQGLDADELLPGPVAKQDVVRYVQACDATLSSVLELPVLEPASINKVFDSLAAGRPVLMAHGGWLTDVVVEAGAGWRVPRSSVEAAARVVANALATERRTGAAAAAADVLALEFDRDRLYERFRAAVVGDGAFSAPASTARRR